MPTKDGQSEKEYYYATAEGRYEKITNIPEFEVVSMNIFDEEELHHNCTVQVLRNSVTGDVSIGWWPDDSPPAHIAGNLTDEGHW